MAYSLAEVVILALILDWVLRKAHIPGLVGMLLIGVLFGPYVLNMLDPSLLAIGQDLRLIALIVILLRAGFEISTEALRRASGKMLLVPIPALFEGAAITLVGPWLLGLTYMQSALLGAVLAAISPAVVVPMMIRFIEEQRGTQKGIPTLVLAAASLDDVFVITVFSAILGLYLGNEASLTWQVAGVPLSVGLGVAIGLLAGWALIRLFERFNPRATKRVLILIGVSVFLVRAEEALEGWIPFAGFLAVMSIGFIILEKREHMAHEISARLGKVWVFAEILLFVMVGAQVNVEVAWEAGLGGIVLVVLGLAARSAGVYVCLWGTNLNLGERIFIMIAYTPKATVQAAIGAAPLAAMRMAGMETHAGEVILAVAVLSILLTAPLGAWALALAGPPLLDPAPPGSPREDLEAVLESEGLDEDD